MDWFRMYSEFAHDPKVQSMPEAMQRRLMMLLCLRCSNALVTLHETEIAFALRITDEDLAETKVLFLRKQFIDDTWEIMNWDKRQFVSDSSAPRVARHRAKLKAEAESEAKQPRNVTVTPQNRTDTEQIQNQNRADTEKRPVEQKQLDPAQTIFAYWQKTMDSPKSAMDDKRKSLIAKALKAYAPADICKAIRGCSKSPHNMGHNDRKTKFNGLNLILRDAEHIDYFINLDSSGARPGAETIAEMNARLMAEFLGDAQTDDNTIEMVD